MKNVLYIMMYCLFVVEFIVLKWSMQPQIKPSSL